MHHTHGYQTNIYQIAKFRDHEVIAVQHLALYVAMR